MSINSSSYSKSLTISYSWWECDDAISRETPYSIRQTLDEQAQKQIADSLASGQYCKSDSLGILKGDLSASVNIDVGAVKAPEDGFRFLGNWQLEATSSSPEHAYLDLIPATWLAAIAMDSADEHGVLPNHPFDSEVTDEEREQCIDSVLERLTPEVLDVTPENEETENGETTFAEFLINQRPEYVEKNMTKFPEDVKSHLLATLLAAKN
jgi:hypothetical protein